jgi:hypothetical protein
MQRRNFLSIFPVGLLSFFGKNEVKAVVIPEPEVKKEEIVYGKLNGNVYGVCDGLVVYKKTRFKEAWFYSNGEPKRVIRNSCDFIHETHYDDTGSVHCAGAPAFIESLDGEILQKKWYQHGRPHRIGGPAVETKSLTAWWQNGKLHRLNGPAKIYLPDSRTRTEEYWINGVQVSNDEFVKASLVEFFKS